MKHKIFYPFFVLAALFINVPQASALPTTTTETLTENQEKSFVENVGIYLNKLETKRQKAIQKVIAKGKKFVSNALDIDLDDPVRKWLWYAIFAACASVLLTLISFFVPFVGWLSYPAYLASVVFFILWLVKYLEADSK